MGKVKEGLGEVAERGPNQHVWGEDKTCTSKEFSPSH